MTVSSLFKVMVFWGRDTL